MQVGLVRLISAACDTAGTPVRGHSAPCHHCTIFAARQIAIAEAARLLNSRRNPSQTSQAAGLLLRRTGNAYEIRMNQQKRTR